MTKSDFVDQVASASGLSKKDAFTDPELERLIHGLGQRLGYDVGAHDVVLHGSCPNCS